MARIKWFSEISDDDIGLVGRECYDLSLLYKARMPVANGFCITKDAWNEFLQKAGVKNKLDNLLSQANAENNDALSMVAEEIKKIILSSDINPELKKEVSEAYSNMSVSSELHGLVNTGAMSIIKAGREMPYVSIGVSFTDGMVGNNVMYNVKGMENVLLGLKKCWAESINADILSKIIKKETKDGEAYPSMVMQKMINSSRAGIVHLNGDKIVIKAYWGLSSIGSLEQIKPDMYVVDDNGEYSIKSIDLNNQAYAFVRDDNLGQVVKKEIPLTRRNIQILSEAEIKRLAKVIGDITGSIGDNKQIEWAVDEGRLFIISVKKLRQAESYNEEVYDNKDLVFTDTVTDISLSIDDMETEVKDVSVSGIGMLESMLVQNKDEYFYYMRDGMEDAIVNGIADRLVKLTNTIGKKEIWYKIIDRPDKFYDWRYELEKEANPDVLIGLEMAAIRKARDLGFNNIGILLPGVTDTDKIKMIKGMIRKIGADAGNDIMLGAVIDNPASVQMINEICQEKINLVSIDINRLARHTLALRKGDEVNAMHPAVLRQVKTIAETAGKNNVKVAVNNFDASLDMIEHFVKLGIDNITAKNDDIELVRKSVAKVEKRLLLSVARDSFKKNL